MKLLKYCALMAVAFGVVAGTASADLIKFTFTGTPDNSWYGYTVGQSYSFSYTLNIGFMNNASSSFDATKNRWGEELVSEAPLYTAVSGDGLIGTWQRPVSSEGDPYSVLESSDFSGQHWLNIYASTDDWHSIGLQASGTDIAGLAVGSVRIGNIFSFPGEYTDPNVYFSGVAGTYLALQGVISLIPVDGSNLYFDLTSVKISAIPEPSTTVLVAFGGVAALLRFRRNRHQR